ncbi:MAG: hypothetical protein NWE89_07550 [Candidatus Bathyarchaeota archaeon]|nr:hypothetical protein [Candidatus Bathyarchaeota archaeon]
MPVNPSGKNANVITRNPSGIKPDHFKADSPRTWNNTVLSVFWATAMKIHPVIAP